MITAHDGPARLGKYGELNTPALLRLDNSKTLVKDESAPYDVPKPIAEFSVRKTIQYALESNSKGIAVIHGSKYLDLRIQCARELEKLGNEVLTIANPEELIKRPRDLVNVIVNLKEVLNPNTALYFPFNPPCFIPLLAYMGIDFFGEDTGDFYAYLRMMLTPHRIYDLKKYPIYDLSREELKDHNQITLDFVVREVIENIKNGTLRNLVEERCCSSPETMSALRILDRDYRDFLDKYTLLY
jgi:7-cyano-7-deazaguanine tRNA-ribosyltransferase